MDAHGRSADQDVLEAGCLERSQHPDDLVTIHAARIARQQSRVTNGPRLPALADLLRTSHDAIRTP